MKFSSYDIRVFDAFCEMADSCSSPREMSMQKIADIMGISRQALNKVGYHKLDDILSPLHIYIDQDCWKKLATYSENKGEQPVNFFAHEIIPLLYKKRRYLKTLYGSVADPSWLSYIEKRYSPILYPYLQGFINLFGFEKEFAAKIVIRYILAILARWLQQDISKTPEEFCNQFTELTNLSITDMISG
ncbi:MAG: TetR family transcriptional regulator C-terminal domain-containing protein [Streptococcaceae bacterium]|jgi:hypothetical protein|nr:TetR family transcriptional regulator C-terminal domain-containing protein [Streptococcaceae bacterium]